MIGVTVLLHRRLAGCRRQEVGSRTERFSRVVTDTHTDWPQTDRPQTDIPSDYRPTDRQVVQPSRLALACISWSQPPAQFCCCFVHALRKRPDRKVAQTCCVVLLTSSVTFWGNLSPWCSVFNGQSLVPLPTSCVCLCLCLCTPFYCFQLISLSLISYSTQVLMFVWAEILRSTVIDRHVQAAWVMVLILFHFGRLMVLVSILTATTCTADVSDGASERPLARKVLSQGGNGLKTTNLYVAQWHVAAALWPWYRMRNFAPALTLRAVSKN